MTIDNNMLVLGRLIPDSGKIHQNQEVYHIGGTMATLKASHYKDPPKVCVLENNDESNTNYSTSESD